MANVVKFLCFVQLLLCGCFADDGPISLMSTKELSNSEVKLPTVVQINTTTTSASLSVTVPTTKSTSSENPIDVTNTTTELPKTSSTSPKTSTESPKTSSETPKPTTVAPTTSTLPPSKESDWVVVGKNNVTCIHLKGNLTFNITYNVKSDKKGVVAFQDVHVPSNATATGVCNSTDQSITLAFFNSSSVTLAFARKNETYYYLKEVHGHIQKTNGLFPNSTETFFNFLNQSLNTLETPLNKSYLCRAESSIVISNTTTLYLSDYQAQAFGTSNTSGFDAAIECPNNYHPTPDIIPIVVGCFLAVLVIVILVAFLISRRRSREQGYHSM